MAINNFVPELWAPLVLEALETSLVFAQDGVINKDYEGEIREKGDTVRISSVGDPTVSTYTKNSNITAVETLTDAQTTLLIDQAKAVNFQVDDIDKAQQSPKIMDEVMQRSGYVLAKGVDVFLAGKYTDIPAVNSLDHSAFYNSTSWTTGTLAGTDKVAYNVLVDLGTVLDNNDVPEQGRWAVIPPWFYGLLMKDTRFVGYGTPPQDERLKNGAPGTGYVGQVSGLAVFKSNNVQTSSSRYKIMAGHSISWTLAVQIAKMEAYRPEARFADAVKGLLLYGGKVVRPATLALASTAIGTL